MSIAKDGNTGKWMAQLRVTEHGQEERGRNAVLDEG